MTDLTINEMPDSGTSRDADLGEVVLYCEKLTVRHGEVYLLEESRPDMFFEIFSEAMAQGTRTFLLTREFPERIRKNYNPQAATVLWLSNVLGKDRIQPSKLGIILSKLSSFPRDENSLIMLEGLEYLINQNGFNPVVSFLNNARDQVIVRNASMIVSFDPETVEMRERAILEKNVQVITPSSQRQTFLKLESGVLKIANPPKREP